MELIQSSPWAGASGLWAVATPVLGPRTAASAWRPLIKPSVSLPEPVPGPEPFRKKEVVEILSHKKAYNTCEGLGVPGGCGGQDATPHRATEPLIHPGG